MAERVKTHIAGRIVLVIVTVLLLILLAAYGVMWILVHGPSPTARRLFVLSVRETSAGGFLANLYLSEDEITAILEADSADLSYEAMDASLVSVPKKKKKAAETTKSVSGAAETAPAAVTTEAETGAGEQTEAPAPEDDAQDVGSEEEAIQEFAMDEGISEAEALAASGGLGAPYLAIWPGDRRRPKQQRVREPSDRERARGSA